MSEAEPQTCWLCARPLGRRVERHHPIPKSRGGRETVPLHPICHRAIHVNFSNAELQRLKPTADALLQNNALRRFVDWVASKPPDFHARTARPR